MNKTLKVMTSAALLAGVVAPVAVTTADAANTQLIVTKVPTVVDDYDSTKDSGVYTTADAITVLQLKADDITITGDQRFRLQLPDGVEFVEDAYDNATREYAWASSDEVVVENVSKKTLELKTKSGVSLTGLVANIPLFVKVDTTGDLKVTVDSMDSSFTSGTYTFAVAQGGSTSATIESVKTHGDGTNKEVATIRIDENAVGAMKDGRQDITLKLPNNVEWDGSATVKFSGGFGNSTTTISPSASSPRTLTINFDPADNRTTRGTIYIEGAHIKIDEDASFGDISVDISGDEVSSQDLVIAKYSDYGASVKLDNDVRDIVAGTQYDGGDVKYDDVKTAKLFVKEDVADTLASGRTTTVKFPSWVKVIGYKVTDAKNVGGVTTGSVQTAGISKDANSIDFNITTTASKAAEFKVEFYLSVQADKTGDITAELSGRSGLEGEFVVAKAVAPVSVDVKATDLEIGVKDQQLADIIITENVKGALKDGKFKVTLPDNVSFASKPTVEVVEGNIEVDEIKLTDSNDGNDDILEVEVDGESTKASKIKISGAKITLDRTVPVGAITAKLGGDFINNSTDDEINYDSKFEDKDYVAEFVIANVVTPAPGQSVAKEVQFTIGSTTYTVAGEEKTMDVAPFVEAGRTYMPIRYVAEAVGVTGDSIFWDQATSTATLIKGDRVVQLTNGSKSLKVNGAVITMDAAAKVKDGRTVLPIRFVGQALGATVNYNDADKSVTIK